MLTSKIKYKIDDIQNLAIKNVKDTYNNILIRDSAYFLIKKIKKKQFKKSILRGFITIVKQKIKDADSISTIECFIDIGEKISSITGKSIVQWNLYKAKVYEREMKQTSKSKNNSMVSAFWCQKAIKYYKKVKNKEKVNKLLKIYNKLCESITYKTFKYPYHDLNKIIEDLKKDIDKKNSFEVLEGLIYSFIPNYDDNKKVANEIIEESGCIGLVQNEYKDIYGHTVKYANNDEEIFKYQLWNVYRLDYDYYSILISHYIFHSLKTGKLNANIIISYLKNMWLGQKIEKNIANNNKLVYTWINHLIEPINSYFDKLQRYHLNNKYLLSFINEVDSLTLKIEGIIRDLIEFAQIDNFPPMKMKKDINEQQIFEWRSINDLLWDEYIFEVIYKDDVWFMRFFLTDFMNLRNNIAHCLVLSNCQEEYYYSIQWLIIIILRLATILKIKL